MHTEGDLQQFGSINPPSEIWFLNLCEAPCAAWMLSFCVAVNCGMEGDGETTPSVHYLRFLRAVTQEHISSKALEVFAGISNFLGIFTAHLDESSKHSNFIKNHHKIFWPYQLLTKLYRIFFACFVCAGEKGEHLYISQCIKLHYSGLSLPSSSCSKISFKDNQSCLWRKSDDDFSRLLPVHLVKKNLCFNEMKFSENWKINDHWSLR